MILIFPALFAFVAYLKKSLLSILALSVSMMGLIFVSSDVVFSSDLDKIVSQSLINSLFAFFSALLFRKHHNEIALYVSSIAAFAAFLVYIRLFIHLYVDDLLLYNQMQYSITEMLNYSALVILGLIAFTPSDKDFIGYVRHFIASNGWFSSIFNNSLHRKD